MTCHHCSSPRTAKVTGKTGDLCTVTLPERSMTGYVPQYLGIGGGDYIQFTYCLDCGQIQGSFPVTPQDEDN